MAVLGRPPASPRPVPLPCPRCRTGPQAATVGRRLATFGAPSVNPPLRGRRNPRVLVGAHTCTCHDTKSVGPFPKSRGVACYGLEACLIKCEAQSPASSVGDGHPVGVMPRASIPERVVLQRHNSPGHWSSGRVPGDPCVVLSVVRLRDKGRRADRRSCLAEHSAKQSDCRLAPALPEHRPIAIPLFVGQRGRAVHGVRIQLRSAWLHHSPVRRSARHRKRTASQNVTVASPRPGARTARRPVRDSMRALPRRPRSAQRMPGRLLSNIGVAIRSLPAVEP